MRIWSRALSRYISRFFSPILCFPTSFFPLFFPPYYLGFLAFFSFLSCTPWSGLEPLTFRIHVAYQSFFYTTTPRDSVEVYPPKLIFILLGSLACPKINITVYYMLHACCTLHENMHRICGSWRIKGGGDDLFLSPNPFHLSCPSSYKVPFSYINTTYSLNFLPRGLCRQNNELSCGANRRTRYDCWDWWV